MFYQYLFTMSKLQPKGPLYQKVEAYLVFTQSSRYGKERVKFKGVVRAESQIEADKKAKQLSGKMAFAELNCAINEQRYKQQGILTSFAI